MRREEGLEWKVWSVVWDADEPNVKSKGRHLFADIGFILIFDFVNTGCPFLRFD